MKAPVVALSVAYPAGQGEQEVEAETLLKYPLSHAVHTVVPLHGVHIVDLVMLVNDPMGQGEQLIPSELK